MYYKESGRSFSELLSLLVQFYLSTEIELGQMCIIYRYSIN